MAMEAYAVVTINTKEHRAVRLAAVAALAPAGSWHFSTWLGDTVILDKTVQGDNEEAIVDSVKEQLLSEYNINARHFGWAYSWEDSAAEIVLSNVLTLDS